MQCSGSHISQDVDEVSAALVVTTSMQKSIVSSTPLPYKLVSRYTFDGSLMLLVRNILQMQGVLQVPWMFTNGRGNDVLFK